MLTREEVATCLNVNIDNVSMLCDVGVLKPTKIGRAYMFSQGMLLKFQHDYEGLNVCNRLRALVLITKLIATRTFKLNCIHN